MKRIYKNLSIDIDKKSLDDASRTFTAVASTEDVDRDGDVIKSDGWKLKEFRKNPVIPWSHNYSLPPVAKALNVSVKDKKLMVKMQFPGTETVGENSFEDKIFKMYRDGYLSTLSVGFDPIKHQYVERDKGKSGVDFLEQNLWEISAVTIPSNPNAALQRAKTAGVLTEDDIEILEKWTKEPGNVTKDITSDFESLAAVLRQEGVELKDEPEEIEEIELSTIKDQIDKIFETLLNQYEIMKGLLERGETKTNNEKVEDTPDKLTDPQLEQIFNKLKTEAEVDSDQIVEAFDLALSKVPDKLAGIAGKAINKQLGIVDTNNLTFKRRT